MQVVCTAGHVDHGKSALVRALTGMEPDRFDEERRRGLTIDLGFAWTTLDHHTIAFVDLPGHERFVTNMLAGAGPVECALFVVAADEGWMPQSREHLQILDLLGVRRGLVALSKIDLVDAETVQVAGQLVREQLEGSTLEHAEIVGASATTGAGMDELRAALTRLLDGAPASADRGRPRLWVDRSFTVRGAGTVVTGTLGGGALPVGADLEVRPQGHVGRIRGMQSLQASIERAEPGSRVALNLSGVDRGEVGRGDSLVIGDQWLSVNAFEARVRVLPGHTVERKGAWHLHAGSAERLARVFPVAGAAITDEGYVRVEFDRALSLEAGDSFVLREAGRQATIGGGTVLDPDPPPRAVGARRAQRVAALDNRLGAIGEPAALLGMAVRERGAYPARQAAAACGLTARAAQAAAGEQGLLPLGGAWASPEAVSAWMVRISEDLTAYHQANPLHRTAAKDLVVRAAVGAGCPPELADDLIDVLVRLGRLAADGPGLRLPGHSVELAPEEAAARDRLLAVLATEPFSPPGLSDATRDAGAPPALVRELEADGALIRLGPDLAVTSDGLEAAADRLRSLHATEGPFTAARAKEALGTSRKYALPILEELDRRGVTRRQGDLRTVLEPPPTVV